MRALTGVLAAAMGLMTASCGGAFDGPYEGVTPAQPEAVPLVVQRAVTPKPSPYDLAMAEAHAGASPYLPSCCVPVVSAVVSNPSFVILPGAPAPSPYDRDDKGGYPSFKPSPYEEAQSMIEVRLTGCCTGVVLLPAGSRAF